MMERFLVPLGPYVLLTAGIAVCIYIFFTLKVEILELRARLTERDTRLHGMLEDIEFRLEGLNRKTRDADERAGVLVTPAPAAPGNATSLPTGPVGSAHGLSDPLP